MASNARNKLPRTLSSPLTFLAKFFVPPVLIGCSAAAFLWTSTHVPAGETRVTFFSILLGLGCIFLAAIAFSLAVMPLKRVRIDAHRLYVSNYREEIAVPLTDVAEVAEFRPTGKNINHVLIRFHSTTAFGSKVVFSPDESGWIGACQIAGEIRASAARATRRERALTAREAPESERRVE